MPNPVRLATTLRFSLPSAAAVSLDIYDVLGRRVTSALGRAIRPAGANETALRGDGSQSGVYFCRFRVGDAHATRKTLVVR